MLCNWLIKSVNKDPEVKTYNFSGDDETIGKAQYKELTKIVAGYIELVPIGPNILLVCNEDGMALNLNNNCGFLGNIAIIKSGNEDCFNSLTDEDIEKGKKYLESMKHKIHSGNGFRFREFANTEAFIDSLEKSKKETIINWELLK